MGSFKKVADSWYSKYIRVKNSFELGGEFFCRCISCGTLKHIKDIDNGHFISRGHEIHRYNDDNCWPQCKKCNRFKGEEVKFDYEENLISKIGCEAVNLLKQTRHHECKRSKYDYSEMAKSFRTAFREQCKRKGIMPW